MSRVA